jgi:hypothetical protein
MDVRPAIACPFCSYEFGRRDLGETGHVIHARDTHGGLFDRDALQTFAEICRERRAGSVSDEDLANAGMKRGLC